MLKHDAMSLLQRGRKDRIHRKMLKLCKEKPKKSLWRYTDWPEVIFWYFFTEFILIILLVEFF